MQCFRFIPSQQRYPGRQSLASEARSSKQAGWRDLGRSFESQEVNGEQSCRGREPHPSPARRMFIMLGWIWVALGCVVATEHEAKPGHLYTSLLKMDSLFTFDKMVGDLLPLLPEHIPKANRYQESYWSVAVDRAKAEGDVVAEALTGNPLHVYSVIKRLYLYWPAINNALNHYSTPDGVCQDRNFSCHRWAMRGHCLHHRDYMVLNCPTSCNTCVPPELSGQVKALLDAQEEVELPGVEDMRGVAYALARLQRTYRIPIGSVMQGRLAGVPSSVRLTAQDCLIVANASHYFQELSVAWVWYDYCRASAMDDPTLQAQAEMMMEKVARQHDEEWNDNGDDYFPFPLSTSTNQQPKDRVFAQVCRGVHKADENVHTLCHVSNRGVPYLILQPVRYEQLHDDPEIYIFYDVLSDAEIGIIKDLSEAQLQRAGVLSAETYSEIRVSYTAWLRDQAHPLLLSVSRRITYITGLLAYQGPREYTPGEALQVAKYGIGGHYDEHLDALYKVYPEGQWNQSFCDKIEILSGDRIATWMFYLSDVQAGGRTAFPDIGVSVAPVKGAAVFWYNLKRNGDSDSRSQHGGCPVLLGHKWVANKWIREHANFLRRPCGTDPED